MRPPQQWKKHTKIDRDKPEEEIATHLGGGEPLIGHFAFNAMPPGWRMTNKMGNFKPFYPHFFIFGVFNYLRADEWLN